jgi:hypothetical protein
VGEVECWDTFLLVDETSYTKNIRNTCSFNETDQVNPGESYAPLLMSLVKSASISVDEGEETG